MREMVNKFKDKIDGEKENRNHNVLPTGVQTFGAYNSEINFSPPQQ
jgi:hypothetical protein